MDSLENLINAAEKRKASDALLRAGEKMLGSIGDEALAKGSQLDETGSLEQVQKTAQAVRKATGLFK